MASTDLDMREVLFQTELRSKPVRLNFQDIENNFNALRAEVSTSIASTSSEVTSARDNFTTLSSNINERRVYGNNIFGKNFVNETTTPGMKLSLLGGTGIIGGVGVDWTAASSATLTAPSAGLGRIDIVTVNTDNSVSIVAGTATSAEPQFPSFSTATKEQIAAVYLTAGTSSLSDNTHIFNIKEKNANYLDRIISASATIGNGNYIYNNLIIHDNLTLDSIDMSTVKIQSSHKRWFFKTIGNMYNVSGTLTGSAVTNSGIVSEGKRGFDNSSPNDIGGSSIFAKGGLGQYGVHDTDHQVSSRQPMSFVSGGSASGQPVPSWVSVSGGDVYWRAGVSLVGADEAQGAGAGGNFVILCRGSLDVNATVTLTGGGTGQAGGAGGNVILRYGSITDNLGVSQAGGSGSDNSGESGINNKIAYKSTDTETNFFDYLYKD